MTLGHIPTFQLNALLPNRVDEPLTLASTQKVAPGELDEWLGRGVTICVNDISAADDQLYAYARAIKLQLGYVGNIRFNCYLSPDGSGADTHFDARVSTTIQIEGNKRWRFSKCSAVPWPLSNAQVDFGGRPVWMAPWAGHEDWERSRPAHEESFMEVILGPGDVLCLPAGTWHNAKAIGRSLALNLAFSPVQFFSVLTRIVETEFMRRAQWRGGPPPIVATDVRSDTLPKEVESYLADRLQELREFLSALELTEPRLLRVWQDMVGS
ncbi:MAG: JmjC domain-containing protein [Gammaproteobacteria bacterium]